MSVLAQIAPQLTEALADVSMIGGLALAFYVAFFVFKLMRSGVHPTTIKRHGNVYELDTTYTPKLPKYQYVDGLRYVLKEPEDVDDPYELDGDPTPDSELFDQGEAVDFIDHDAPIDQAMIDRHVDDFYYSNK